MVLFFNNFGVNVFLIFSLLKCGIINPNFAQKLQFFTKNCAKNHNETVWQFYFDCKNLQIQNLVSKHSLFFKNY
jgi:hypothetical protein